MSSWSAISLQNAASPLMEQLTFFHDHTMTILILIVTIVGFSLISTCMSKNIDQFMLESQPLELFWTIAPSFILIFIGLPSIRLLYLLDETFKPAITLKIMGHQWYWSYEYSDFLNIEFDSYMTPEPELSNNAYRLLDVDTRTVFPLSAQIRTLISAADVLHAWTVPALGVKADAVPGRLNQVNFFSPRPGVFFGQCSEICGANHSFMPIALESVTPSSFVAWVKTFN